MLAKPSPFCMTTVECGAEVGLEDGRVDAEYAWLFLVCGLRATPNIEQL